LDGKGRITVPSRFRDVLVATVQGQLVVCKAPDGCLALFPLPVWEQFEAEMRTWPLDLEGWRRLYVGSATDVEIDSGVARADSARAAQVGRAGPRGEVHGRGGLLRAVGQRPLRREREAAMLAGERPDKLRNFVIR
jgi:MraZ protein